MKDPMPHYRIIRTPRALLSLGLMLGVALNCQAQEVLTLKASKDAHVRGGSQYRDLNFGSEGRLEVKTGAAHSTRMAYIGFDLPVDVAKIEGAFLVFAVVSGEKNQAPVQINHSAPDWDEQTVTFQNKPATFGRLVTIASKEQGSGNNAPVLLLKLVSEK